MSVLDDVTRGGYVHEYEVQGSAANFQRGEQRLATERSNQERIKPPSVKTVKRVGKSKALSLSISFLMCWYFSTWRCPCAIIDRFGQQWSFIKAATAFTRQKLAAACAWATKSSPSSKLEFDLDKLQRIVDAISNESVVEMCFKKQGQGSTQESWVSAARPESWDVISTGKVTVFGRADDFTAVCLRFNMRKIACGK
jgi:hypothetical protein